MKIVEIIGIPGVGKSYLINKVLHREVLNQFDIVKDNDILSKIPMAFGHKSLKNYIRWSVYRVLKHPQRHLLNEYGKEFVLNNQLFVKHVWSLFDHRSDNIYPVDTRILLASYFIRTFEKIESVKNSSVEKYCMIDEGLIQR